MTYPARCEHNVIRCDKCPSAPPQGKLEEEVKALRERVAMLERQLEVAGDAHYDLKQHARQLETMNAELRAVGVRP